MTLIMGERMLKMQYGRYVHVDTPSTVLCVIPHVFHGTSTDVTVTIHMVHSRTSLVASTAASGVMLNIAIADQYLCILLTGNMFRDIYDREGYERKLLSRTTEDSV